MVTEEQIDPSFQTEASQITGRSPSDILCEILAEPFCNHQSDKGEPKITVSIGQLSNSL